MRKSLKKKVLIIGAIVLAAAVLIYYYIPRTISEGTFFTSNEVLPPEGSVQLSLTDYEIYQILQLLSGKSLDYNTIQGYIQSLHIKAWRLDGQTAFSVIDDYNTQYTSEGWTQLESSTDSGLGWSSYTMSWSKLLNGRCIIAAEGSSIRIAYNCDTIVVTSYGLLTTYLQFYNEIG